FGSLRVLATLRTRTRPWGPRVVVGERAAHYKFTFALESPANVLAHVDVSVASQLRPGAEKERARGAVHTVRRALDEKRQRLSDVGRLENHRVQLDAVAHGDHDFGALVVVEHMMDGLTGATVHGLRVIGNRNALRTAGVVHHEVDRHTAFGNGEMGRGRLLQFGRNAAIRLHGELAV